MKGGLLAESEQTESGNLADIKVFRRLFVFIKPYRLQFSALIGLTIYIACSGPLRVIVIMHTINTKLMTSDYLGMVNMILLLVGMLFIESIMQYLHTYGSGWLGQHIIHDIRIRLYRHIQVFRLNFFDNTPIGRLVTRNVSDIETLAEVFTQGIAAMIADLLMLIIIFGLMIHTDWRLALISLALLPILLIATYIFKEKIKSSFNLVRNAVSNLNSFVQEHITGMNIVQIFNAEQREYKKFKKINKEHRQAHMKSVMYYSVYYPVAEVISAGTIALVVWYAAGLMLRETIEPGVVVGFIMFINMFFRPIRMIADRFNTLQMGVVSTKRIVKLLDSVEHIPDNGNYTIEQVKGEVKFENVKFAYLEKEWVLKDISFHVSVGETLGLVGVTGAGKSSVINLLNRFYETNEGKIFLDGRDIRDYELNNLRSHIAVVHQDVFLFSDTIYNNITLRNPDIDRESVMAAADLVGAREFIERLPGKFDYNVMERGATLSVGQRQLISFVRAMVYNPKIIVLDEATSSVDSETEKLIQEAIKKLMKGRTAIVIAHRLSTIQDADQILVIDAGRIVERGNHEKLINNAGLYANLHAMQYKEIASA